MANVVLGAAGAVVGFIAGGPAGALYGAQIGFAIGSYVQGSPSQTVQGPKIGEVATQNAKEGVPRPIVFGVARPIAGNIIASGKPVIRVIREKTSSGGGKGGGGGGGDTYQEREEVYRTYAIRICEGPVNSVRRIWRDNKLVYDALAEDSSTQAENNAEFLKVATLYLGGYDQMPDPALETEFGVGNVTAHRGTCYMVMDTEDLTPRRGSIPNYIFEVARGEGFALTTKPYPLEYIEAAGTSAVRTEVRYGALVVEPFTTSAGIVSGRLAEPLVQQEQPPENFLTSSDVVSGSLRVTLKSYDNYAPEEFNTSADIVSGSLQVILVEYDNYAPEEFTTSADVIGGSLQ